MKSFPFLRKICFAFIILVFPLKAQKITTAEIDTLQENISKIEWNLGDFKKSILLQKDVIEKS
ncbi:hypothetical protein [Chryseobacterium sp. AG844]|uniref:hypothetical protein n=1 Tax=Chryseobacterium sp. AG844 TaxID=2183998 RepID=UPI000D717156|nr:hypothetical protein [Chryseobacterium sp. AG844]PWW27111.1 hypothetical protein DEU40_10740 [Chryseobacterium sp. AG844]